MMYRFNEVCDGIGEGCSEGFNRIGGFGHFGFMGLFGLLILIAAVVIIVLLVRNKKSSNSNLLEELKLLYIKGEITEEEYLNRKNVIGKK